MTDVETVSNQIQRSSTYKTIVLGLATLMAANPVIIFLLTKSILTSILATSMAVAMIIMIYSWSKLKMLTVYLFNFMCLLSILVHAEVVLHHVYPEYVITNLYTIEDGYYFNRPLLEEKFRDKEYSTTYKTNSQGFRIADGQDSGRRIERTDWLVLGDSFTQGAQVEFEQLYTSFLNARFPDKIVLNAGISGLGIGHEFNYFVKDGFRYKPDLVILQLCSFNDFMNVVPQGVSFTDRLMADWSIMRLILSDIRYQDPRELPLGRWTEPFRPDHQGNVDGNIFYKEVSSRKQDDIAAFGKYVQLFDKAVKSVGAELLIVLIPTREQVYRHCLEEVTKEFSIDENELDMGRPNSLLSELTGKLGIHFVDALPAFSEARGNMFFEFDEHLTLRGHEVLAETVGDFIETVRGKSSVRMMTKVLSGDRYPMYSPDGSTISYQSLRDGNMELFLADENFENGKRLTFNNLDETHPSLSLDASKVLFTEGPAELFETEVVLMNLDGTEKQTITGNDSEFGAIPTFSPSNKQIAYALWHADGKPDGYSLPQIVVRDFNSSQVTLVTNGQRENWRPVFSPDERELVYISRIDDQFDLFAYDFSTKVERRLTNTPFDEWDPQFSPNGYQLVYAAQADGNWDLFVMDLRDSSVTRLTRTKGDEWDPSVSPDGKTLIFAGSFGLLEAVYSMDFPQ